MSWFSSLSGHFVVGTESLDYIYLTVNLINYFLSVKYLYCVKLSIYQIGPGAENAWIWTEMRSQRKKLSAAEIVQVELPKKWQDYKSCPSGKSKYLPQYFFAKFVFFAKYLQQKTVNILQELPERKVQIFLNFCVPNFVFFCHVFAKKSEYIIIAAPADSTNICQVLSPVNQAKVEYIYTVSSNKDIWGC